MAINLNRFVKEILKKYEHCDFPDNLALPELPNRLINRYLKKLCELADGLRRIFSKSPGRFLGATRLAKWYETVKNSGFDSFKVKVRLFFVNHGVVPCTLPMRTGKCFPNDEFLYASPVKRNFVWGWREMRTNNLAWIVFQLYASNAYDVII